ncbi:MAG: hypothetical protein AABZ69_00955, partial [Candidatus Binatota bacterium]
ECTVFSTSLTTITGVPGRPDLSVRGRVRFSPNGRYALRYPTGGIGTTDEKIKTDPAGIRAFVKASQKGLQFARQNRAESMKIIADYLGVKDAALSEQIFELYLSRLSADGSADESWMKGAIEFTKKSLGAVEKEVASNQVFDFSFVPKPAR